MASAFWILEDGRAMARGWAGMAYMLRLICTELQEIEGAEDFYEYLNPLVYRKEQGDEGNGFGGFLRNGESIMFNIDVRTFSQENRNFFWQAAQKALAKIKTLNKQQEEGVAFLLTILLDMHKRIKKGEDPMLLNDLKIIAPNPS